MPDLQVQRGSRAKLGRVEGELKVGNDATIEAIDGKLTVVTKNASFEGDGKIVSDFECDSLTVKHGGTLRVDGNLVVHKLLDVNHTIDVIGSIKAGEIDVGGKIRAGSIECVERIRVGGVLEVRNALEAKTVDVGGKAEVLGPVKLRDLNVGGVANVAGGVIPGMIRVGGKFESSAGLEFGDLQVYGRILLPAGCKGGKISTYGRLATSGDFTCNEIEIKGRTDIQGNCKSERVEVSGALKVGGSLELSGELSTWGQTEIAKEFNGSNLRIGGSFKALRGIVSNEVELVGNAETGVGMKGNIILVRSGSKCKGVLVGKKVEIGRSHAVVSNWSRKFAGQTATFRLIGRETRVGDIYATEVHLGRGSRCGKVFGEVVEFEEGCIAEEITYTKTIRGRVEEVFINRPFPKRVARLPDPPL